MIKGEYMTRFFNSKLKTKLIVLLSVICLLFTSVGLYACKEENEVKDPTYTVEEESADVLIKNASFDIGTYGVELKSYPITSPKSWTKAQTDNYSTSSSVNSGVVDTKSSSWETILKNLYSDGDFVTYLKNVYDYTEADLRDGVRAEKGDDNYEPSQEELIDFAIKTYVNVDGAYVNPGKSPDSDDSFVYMLNNVGKNANFNLGLAQKITSSSTVNMKKDMVYAVSIWVKTVNLAGQGDFGANIRLNNNFDSKAQKEYRISSITCTDWTKYTIYVKSDANYTSTFSLVLGLGYGNGDANASQNYTEGTVYFDEITIEEIKAEDFNEPISADYMILGSEDPTEATLVKKTDTHFACVYEMNLKENEKNYLSTLSNLNATSAFTTSNITGKDGNPLTSASEEKVGIESTQTLTTTSTEYKMEVNKASATITIKDSAKKPFTLASGKYALVSFYLRNELVAPAETSVYLDVMDVYNGVEVKRASTITISEPNDDFTRYILLVKNNFEYERSYYFNFVVGPNDISSVIYNSDFSTGSVIIKDFEIATDFIDSEKANEDNESIYNFLSGKSSATVALYAGYNADYTEEDKDTTYNFSTRPGNFGDVMFNPTAVEGYTGIVPNHTYINSSATAETYVDTRVGVGTTEGVAGLINTKYLSTYTNGNEIKEKLAFNDDDEDMQLIMINNKTANHYGFIGNKVTFAEDKNGAVTVTLKVLDNATAYVYLVDVSGVNKNVLNFDDFTVNTDVVAGVENGTKVDGKALRYELKVTSDMMDADGYATVSFYVGTGATAKSFRVEVWNGARDGATETASQGYVFVKNITTNGTSGFTEPASWNSSFSVSGNPLYDNHKASFDTLYAYERQLTEIEKQFNKEYPDEAISYKTKYIWAESDKVIYGMFNAIDPVVDDPFEGKEEEQETKTGCTAESDPSTFWLSFSSILLAVLLVAAIIVLILKKVIAKRKANKSDALSHYKVTSRIRSAKKVEKVEEVKEETTEEQVIEETTEETEEVVEDNSNEYVYGEVQSFGDEKEEETTSEEIESTKEETSNE